MAILGHFLAFASVFIWSSLYVSTKILLDFLTPLELMILQFSFGYVLLLALKPKILPFVWKNELLFALAGLSGICIYNLFLNLAMEQTFASNVSIIIATAPLFAGIFAYFLKLERLSAYFFIGFLIAICGIAFLNFSDLRAASFNFLGDLFALISSIGWGLYSVIIALMAKGRDLLLSTRRIIFYGLIFSTPSLLALDFNPNFNAFLNFKFSANFIFVASFSSAFCFLAWNKATHLIGSVKTNIYVYLTPLFTIIVAYFALGENIGFLGIFGGILTLSGVAISMKNNRKF
ncbi:MAG: DMT family transporter [Helicobacter sp.]|nr:DMT family transporter [Helicobacteraceae bacterium]MDY3114100.1 DMT family transporter [Helicobacter sp.]